MVSAFAVVYGISTAAVTCGFVTPSAPKEDSQYVRYTNTTATATATAKAASNFIAITPARAADELIQVLVK